MNTSVWRAQSHYGTAGVAAGGATLFDRHGPIGTSSALALAQAADAFNPSSRDSGLKRPSGRSAVDEGDVVLERTGRRVQRVRRRFASRER